MRFANLNFSDLLVEIPALLICFTIHEVAHGFAACKLGDTTARDAGRLSFNPLRHIDVLGFLCIILFGFGWAKPVQCDVRNFKNPKTGLAITAVAGPLSNFILAFVSIFAAVGIIAVGNKVAFAASQFFAVLGSMSIVLGIFNLIPIPPLDGSNIIMPFLPYSVQDKIYRYQRYFLLILIFLLYSNILNPALTFLTNNVFAGMVSVSSVFWNLFW